MASAHRLIILFIDSVLQANELKIKLPSTREQWEKVRKGFESISRNGILVGCCGVIDGLLQKTISPTIKETANVRAFYSGHYEHYGLNCQGVCDSRLCFMYFRIVGPGSMNDNVAIHLAWNLIKVIEGLPFGCYMIGDAAYTLTEHLLIPFSGPSRDQAQHDTYNFYLSQLRIRIEMAFGMLVNRFRILKRPLQSKMKRNARIILACAILHNFVLDDTYSDESDRSGLRHTVSDCEDDNVTGTMDVDCDEEWIGDYAATGIEEDHEVVPGFSMTRNTIVEFLKNNGYRRPRHNLLRNGRL